jgi:hypothetical protein
LLGATTDIRIENVINLESLSSEFQFIKLRRQVVEIDSRYLHLEVARLKSAIEDLQMRPAGQDQELCQLAEARVRQLEDLWGVIDEVAKEQ